MTRLHAPDAGTGAGLLGLFHESPVLGLAVNVGAVFPQMVSTPVVGAALASVTMPMHDRAGLNPNALSAGFITAGTASAAGRWAGQLVAARGYCVTLDSQPLGAPGAHESAFRVLGDVSAEHRVVEVSQDSLGMLYLDPFAIDVSAPSPFTIDPLASDPDASSVGDSRVEQGDVPMSTAMQRLAQSMTDIDDAVPVARPEVPELSDRPLENVRRLFALTVAQLGDLLGVTERQAHRYLSEGLPEGRRPLAEALTAVGLTVIGGLGADGAREWLYSGKPTGAQLATSGRIAELGERAQALRDSPAT
jgi:hypothetical protein